MKRLIGCIAVCSLAVAPAIGQMFNGTIENEHVYGSWTAFTVHRPGDFRFRAFGTDGRVGLMYDVSAPGCQISLAFAVPYEQPATAEGSAYQITGAVRIDQGTVYPVVLTVGATVMGDTGYLIELNTTPQFSAIVAEMETGEGLRIRFNWPNSTPIVRTIPLNGFAVAHRAVESACETAFAQKKKESPSAPPASPDSF